MNIRYNRAENRFEAEFSDFAGDQHAVKEAGFKTTGAPQWIWWTQKVPVMEKLRKNRPASGLTITPEASDVYTPLLEQERKNDEIRKLAKKAKADQEPHSNWLPDGKEYLEREDLPPQPPLEKPFQPPPPPDTQCSNCGQPVYFYELLGVFPLCLFCEKELDNR